MLLLTPRVHDVAAAVRGNGTVITKSYPDGETYVCIDAPNASLKGRTVKLLHRLWPEPNTAWMELYLAIDQLFAMGVERVIPIVPYLSYARADKRVKEGEALSAFALLRMLFNAGVREVVTCDCHFMKYAGEGTYEGIRIKNITLAEDLIAHVRTRYPDILPVSPDKGGTYLVGERGKSMEKVRGDFVENDGTVSRTIVKQDAQFDVRDKDILIIDDIVASGGTMIRACELMKMRGARTVVCAAVHGQFLNNSIDRLKRAGATDVIATDTIVNSVSKISFVAALQRHNIV